MKAQPNQFGTIQQQWGKKEILGTSDLSSVVHCYRLFLCRTGGTFISLKTFFPFIFPWKLADLLKIRWMNKWKSKCAFEHVAFSQCTGSFATACFMWHACLKILLLSAESLYSVNAELELNFFKLFWLSISSEKTGQADPIYSIWPFMFYRFLVSLLTFVWIEQKHQSSPSHSIVLCFKLASD